MNTLNFSKSPIVGKSKEQSLSFTPVNRIHLDKITPTLQIGEHEFSCWAWKIEGDFVVYTYVDIPGNLLGFVDGFYTVQNRVKIEPT